MTIADLVNILEEEGIRKAASVDNAQQIVAISARRYILKNDYAISNREIRNALYKFERKTNKKNWYKKHKNILISDKFDYYCGGNNPYLIGGHILMAVKPAHVKSLLKKVLKHKRLGDAVRDILAKTYPGKRIITISNYEGLKSSDGSKIDKQTGNQFAVAMVFYYTEKQLKEYVKQRILCSEEIVKVTIDHRGLVKKSAWYGRKI